MLYIFAQDADSNGRSTSRDSYRHQHAGFCCTSGPHAYNSALQQLIDLLSANNAIISWLQSPLAYIHSAQSYAAGGLALCRTVCSA